MNEWGADARDDSSFGGKVFCGLVRCHSGQTSRRGASKTVVEPGKDWSHDCSVGLGADVCETFRILLKCPKGRFVERTSAALRPCPAL